MLAFPGKRRCRYQPIGRPVLRRLSHIYAGQGWIRYNVTFTRTLANLLQQLKIQPIFYHDPKF